MAFDDDGIGGLSFAQSQSPRWTLGTISIVRNDLREGLL